MSNSILPEISSVESVANDIIEQWENGNRQWCKERMLSMDRTYVPVVSVFVFSYLGFSDSASAAQWEQFLMSFTY